MKIRMLRNSVRLRLGRSEVERIASGEPVETETSFGATALRYGLRSHADDRVAAHFEDGRVDIAFPSQALQHWANTAEEISLRGELPLPEGEVLKLLVEKDFKCLTPRSGSEEDTDSFEHPNA
jgi:hypothetical protein